MSISLSLLSKFNSVTFEDVHLFKIGKKSMQYHLTSLQDAASLIIHFREQAQNLFSFSALSSFIVKHFFSAKKKKLKHFSPVNFLHFKELVKIIGYLKNK